jgi:hypothetical protein
VVTTSRRVLIGAVAATAQNSEVVGRVGVVKSAAAAVPEACLVLVGTAVIDRSAARLTETVSCAPVVALMELPTAFAPRKIQTSTKNMTRTAWSVLG